MKVDQTHEFTECLHIIRNLQFRFIFASIARFKFIKTFISGSAETLMTVCRRITRRPVLTRLAARDLFKARTSTVVTAVDRGRIVAGADTALTALVAL